MLWKRVAQREMYDPIPPLGHTAEANIDMLTLNDKEQGEHKVAPEHRSGNRLRSVPPTDEVESTA